MSKLTILAAAVGRVLAPLGYAVTVDVTDNVDTTTTVSPAAPRDGARVEIVQLLRRLSHVMAHAPDGIYLRGVVADLNDWTFSIVPGGAVLVGPGPEYHGTVTNEAEVEVPRVDLSASVPRLTMRRIMPSQWCSETTVGLLCYGGGTFDFVGEGRLIWTQDPIWMNMALPISSDRKIDGLGPRTTGVVFGIFAA